MATLGSRNPCLRPRSRARCQSFRSISLGAPTRGRPGHEPRADPSAHSVGQGAPWQPLAASSGHPHRRRPQERSAAGRETPAGRRQGAPRTSHPQARVSLTPPTAGGIAALIFHLVRRRNQSPTVTEARRYRAKPAGNACPPKNAGLFLLDLLVGDHRTSRDTGIRARWSRSSGDHLNPRVPFIQFLPGSSARIAAVALAQHASEHAWR